MQGMGVRGRKSRRPGEMFLLESVVADKVAFALAVGRPMVLIDRDTALDLEYYYHYSTVGAQWE